jgi:pilus assembly protein Flp/PilA
VKFRGTILKKNAKPILKKALLSQRGATAIEYGLIVSLVVIVMLVGLQNFAGTSTTGFNGSMNKLSNAITAR